MRVVTTVCLGGLVAAAGLCLARLARPGSLADRIVALDALLTVVVATIAVFSLRNGQGTYLDLLVVAALLGFVGTVTVARYLERRGT